MGTKGNPEENHQFKWAGLWIRLRRNFYPHTLNPSLYNPEDFHRKYHFADSAALSSATSSAQDTLIPAAHIQPEEGAIHPTHNTQTALWSPPLGQAVKGSGAFSFFSFNSNLSLGELPHTWNLQPKTPQKQPFGSSSLWPGYAVRFSRRSF